MLKRILGIVAALAVPTVLAAQTPIPANEQHASPTARSKTIPAAQASDTARSKVAQAMARRATRVRGQAVGLDNRPVTPAIPATGADRAIPNPGGGGATRAVPPNPATPASPSQKPTDPGSQGTSRRP
jgi:hypothetical protein